MKKKIAILKLYDELKASLSLLPSHSFTISTEGETWNMFNAGPSAAAAAAAAGPLYAMCARRKSVFVRRFYEQIGKHLVGIIVKDIIITAINKHWARWQFRGVC